jgi:hypothetical protein
MAKDKSKVTAAEVLDALVAVREQVVAAREEIVERLDVTGAELQKGVAGLFKRLGSVPPERSDEVSSLRHQVRLLSSEINTLHQMVLQLRAKEDKRSDAEFAAKMAKDYPPAHPVDEPHS